jgi:predicted permease
MTLGQDLRHSFRLISRSPGFAAVAILTLALGVGANTAIFSVVNGTLLKPLAFREPGQLAAIAEESRTSHYMGGFWVNATHFLEWRKEARSFQSLAMLSRLTKNLTGGGEPERLIGGRVSATLFPILGIQPQLGRIFREDEDKAGADHVVVLSHSLWDRRFHADPAILGHTIRLDGEPYRVIGVMRQDLPQAGASGVEWSRAPAEFWVPFGLRDNELQPFGDFNYECIGRLKPGVTFAQATAELNGVQAHIAANLPFKVDLGARVTQLQEEVTGRSRRMLLLFFSAVGMVLLIGCVNIANLLLARAAARSREFAIRMAVGAKRWQLLVQSLTESFVIAAIGGAFGLMITYASFRFLIAHAPADLPRIDEMRIDGGVLLFGLLITALTGVLCGLLPAWRYTGIDPQEGLKAGSRSATEGNRGRRIRSALVSLEVGLSTICLVALGLILHSFAGLMRVDRGFDVQRVLTVNLSLPGPQYAQLEQRKQFWNGLLAKLETLPGVISVGLSNRLPLTGGGTDNWVIPDGRKLNLAERPVADMRFVNPGYFRTLGIPRKRGRIFAESDQGQRVGILSADAAAGLFGKEDPIGRRLRLGDVNTPLITVAGVVGDVRANGLQRGPKFTIYMPYWQRDRLEMALAVRTATDPSAITTAVRQEIRNADRELPVPQFRTMTELLDASVAQRRFQVNILAIFGGLALLLASLGVYGVVSYAVAQRRTEMGVRLALGARPADVGRLVLLQGMAPVLAGMAAGIAAALALGKMISSLLFAVSGHDPATICGVIALLSTVAALACWIPAARTMRIDPIEALRYE